MSETQDFNVFAGAETGVFKGLKISKKCSLSKNFEKISNLTKENGISAISYGSDETEILVALRGQMVKVFDVKDKSYSQIMEAKGGSGPIQGVARYDGAIVTAVESGLVKWWRYENHVQFNPVDSEVQRMGKLRKVKENEWNEEEKEKHAENLKIGRKLCRMRQCPESRNLVAVGGKELDLQVWDLEKPEEPLFRAKNVRQDFLELRVPVWISDIAFLSKDAVAVCSRYGHIRKYEISGDQRRPTAELLWKEKDDAQTCTAICTVNKHQVLVGTSTGKLALWDFRHGEGYRGQVRKYKGCTGAIKGLYHVPGTEYFGAVGLDRHLRVYTLKEQKPAYSLYLKSKLAGLLMTSEFDPEATVEVTKPEIKEVVKQNIRAVEDEDEEKDCIMVEDPVVAPLTLQETKLENLLSLPQATYSDKTHLFYEFFKESKKQRKVLKTTEDESEREAALQKIRQHFENFKHAHADGPSKSKKRRMVM